MKPSLEPNVLKTSSVKDYNTIIRAQIELGCFVLKELSTVTGTFSVGSVWPRWKKPLNSDILGLPIKESNVLEHDHLSGQTNWQFAVPAELRTAGTNDKKPKHGS